MIAKLPNEYNPISINVLPLPEISILNEYIYIRKNILRIIMPSCKIKI